ncbi:hypothetical protein [Paraclostridium bifermentans]|uniref:hypothetical protein n=1 Tax=Paraclostridium bifermentans TaxID=1490 RepID=UPI00374FB0D0
MDDLKEVILTYISTMKTEQGLNTICNQLSMQCKQPYDVIRSTMDFLEYDNKIVYVKVKHNNRVYLTAKRSFSS